ncbi:MAG: zinc ribbon domain-containing protein [archaeon]
MIKCPMCGADNSDQVAYCSVCGVQMVASPPVPHVHVPEPILHMHAPPPAFALPSAPVSLHLPPPPPMTQVSPIMLPLSRPSRPLWATLITIAAGILVIVGVIAAYVYPPSQALVLYLLQILLPATPVESLMTVATVVGVVLTFVLLLAAFLMYEGYGTFGGIIGFIAAVSSITIGGGFLAGFTLGIIGSFLAVMRK